MGENIVLSEVKGCKLESSNTNYATGKLESIDDDGYTVIRLGDSIISVITKGTPRSIGEYVKLKVTDIELYDIGL